MASAKTEIETLTKQLEELTVQLDEKQAELAEVSKANEDEEFQLKHQREKIFVRLKSDTLSRYDRTDDLFALMLELEFLVLICFGNFGKLSPSGGVEAVTSSSCFVQSFNLCFGACHRVFETLRTAFVNS